MRDSWIELVGQVLRPARPRLAGLLEERARHVEARRQNLERRTRAIAECRAHIESARAEVFAAMDGVVGRRMTNLEREWRMLSREDADDGMMDLWARIAPETWIDRKRWRGNPRSLQLDVAIALASDIEGVEAAEKAIDALRKTVAIPIGPRIVWRMFTGEEALPDLFEKHLRRALRQSPNLRRAHALEENVHDAALAAHPHRPILARTLARAAYVDSVCRSKRRDPVEPLRDLWWTGYSLAAFDDKGVTLEVPALAALRDTTT
jgi:hypothetical protein